MQYRKRSHPSSIHHTHRLRMRDSSEWHWTDIGLRLSPRSRSRWIVTIVTTEMMYFHVGKKYPCPSCGMTFPFESQLTDRRTKNKGQLKPTSVGSLSAKMIHCYIKQHIRTHVDVKPFKCSRCERAFQFWMAKSTMTAVKGNSFSLLEYYYSWTFKFTLSWDAIVLETRVLTQCLLYIFSMI